MQYTFTPDELRDLLAQTIKTFAGQSDVYDFSRDGIAAEVAIEDVMMELKLSYDAIPIIPGLDETITWTFDSDEPNFELPADIPFDGQAVTYETTDNISEAELGLMPPF